VLKLPSTSFSMSSFRMHTHRPVAGCVTFMSALWVPRRSSEVQGSQLQQGGLWEGS
jgi:hypothetical protein